MQHFDGYYWNHQHTKKTTKPTIKVSRKVELHRVNASAYPRSGDRFKISKF